MSPMSLTWLMKNKRAEGSCPMQLTQMVNIVKQMELHKELSVYWCSKIGNLLK